MSTRKLLNPRLRTEQIERAASRRALSAFEKALGIGAAAKKLRSAIAGKSFYTPHQGKREIARRARQIQSGKLRADT